MASSRSVSDDKSIHDPPDWILVPLVGEDGPLGGAVVTHGLAAPPTVMLSQPNRLLFIHRLHIPEKWPEQGEV